MPNIDLTAERWYEALDLPVNTCHVITPSDGKSVCVRSKNHTGPHRSVREWATKRRCQVVNMNGFQCVLPEKHFVHLAFGYDRNGNWVKNEWHNE